MEHMTDNGRNNLGFLQPGDVIDIVATSAKCSEEAFIGIRQLIHSWGLECHIPDDLFGDNLLYANSDEKRFKHLTKALLNTKSKVVWSLLGGFGSTRLIPMLEQLPIPNHTKLFVGFSDVTSIHIFLQNHWNWPTIHGPSGLQAIQNKISSNSIEKLKTLLFNRNSSFLYHQIKPLNDLAERDNQINGSIIGGNLHLIQASLGTTWQINADHKIIFIEEIHERAYRVDRALVQLQQSGVLDKAKAILFGDFVDSGEPDGRFLVKETLQAFAQSCSLPVLQINDVGHGPINDPLILGHLVNLRTGKNCMLEFSMNEASYMGLN